MEESSRTKMETVYEILEKFLNSYSFKTKNPKQIYKIFLSYIYFSLETPIKNKDKKENKYIAGKYRAETTRGKHLSLHKRQNHTSSL